MYHDAYAHLYQKINGFKVKIKVAAEKEVVGYLSLKPSTRSTYDIAMRDATIDGLLTSDKIKDIKPSQIFYKINNPNELFILQSVNEFEFQETTRNINAIKQNSFATIQRKSFNEERGIEEYKDIYIDLISFITSQNKDEKNFAAGIEDNTILSIQVPKRDLDGNIYDIQNLDRIILKSKEKDLSKIIKIESIDSFGVSGIIRIFGTYDTRTGE
mgnify:FL=1|nr:MAG TPA: hypothetical protein [Caudoviricetes sp.]